MARRHRRRSSGTGSIFGPDHRGYYTAQVHVGYYANGRRRFARKQSKRESEIVAWMDQQTIKRGAGLDLAPERVTVEHFLKSWLAGVARSNRYSTHRGYAQICRDHVIPRVGKVLMSKLSGPQVQAILDDLDGAGRSRNTIRNVKACLRAATAGVEKTYPSAYDAVRLAKLPKRRTTAATVRALTPEQAQLLLIAVESERLKALYWTTLLLGLRRGEALGLLLDDLDLDGGRLRISGSMQRQTGKGMVRLDYAKTEASETWVPLPDALLPVLHEHLAMLDEERTYHKWREHGLLFPSSIGTPLGDRNLVTHYKKMLARAGLPPIRFHDLRHTCATLLIALGVHPRIVMEILRHAQISTTMNIYGHAIPEVNRQASNALGRLVQPATIELPQKVRKE